MFFRHLRSTREVIQTPAEEVEAARVQKAAKARVFAQAAHAIRVMMTTSSTINLPILLLALCASLVWTGVTAPAARASEVIYRTHDPFGGFFGLQGADVYDHQSVGLRLTPTADYTLDGIGLWFMNNDGSGQNFGTVTVTLRDDKTSGTNGSIPGDTIYESWTFQIDMVGWDPKIEQMASVVHPLLEAGQNYWIVAQSDSQAGVDPVWCFASQGTNFNAYTDYNTGEWQDGGESAAITAIVLGTPAVQTFDLQISDPMNHGEDATFTVADAQPGAPVYLAYSLTGPGSTFVAPLGVTLDLNHPIQAGQAVMADGAGNVRWTLHIPDGAANRDVWFQAAQRGGKSQVQMTHIN